MKRLISIFLTLCIMLCCTEIFASEDGIDFYDLYDPYVAGEIIESSQLSIQLSSYSTSYPNTHANTGNEAKDITEIAKTQIGYAETGDNHTKYNAWYYGYDASVAWCAVFLSWCANQAGISTSVMAKTSSASNNSFSTPTYSFNNRTPQVGDILYIDNNSDSSSDHVGIVVGVDNSYIYSVEGNYSDSVKQVKYYRSNGVSTEWSAAKIILYGAPNYSKTHTHSFPTITYEADHPHREFKACTCGYTEYTGNTVTVSTCSQCTTPGKPSILNMADSYCTNEEITFLWDETVNTTHYNLYIHQKNSTGEYETYKNIFYAENGMSLSLPVGEYFAFLQSTNSNARTDDGSTWRFTNSKLYYFTVTDQPPIANITTASGNYIPVGTNVTFDFEVENARFWYFIVTDEAGERITVELATGKWSYDYAFNEAGTYKVQLQTANGIGWTNVPIYMTVIDTGGSCGPNAYWTLDEAGTLRICGTGEMTAASSYPWDEYEENITEVIVYDGITNIARSTFGGCVNAKTITIPSTVETIEHSAFNGCNNLENLYIAEGVKTIKNYAIQHCYKLKSVNIPSTVTEMNPENNFFRCDSLTEINVAQGNESYSSVDGVLFNKDKTELLRYPCGKTDSSYTIPNGVTKIGLDAFQYCVNLIKIDIPSSVEIIEVKNQSFSQSFSGCNLLTDINVSQENLYYASVDGVLFNKGKTEIIFYPYGKTDSSYTIPNGITAISKQAFSNSGIRSVVIPASVNKIGDYAFPSTLTDVYFTGTEEEWSKIDVEYTKTEDLITTKLNEALRKATKHFESVDAINVSGITINKTNTILIIGETETLTATVAPSNATNQNIIWSSSNNSVATVSNGVVTAISAGTATITVETEDGGYTATCTVTVTPLVEDAKAIFTLSDVSGKPGDTVKVKLSLKSSESINTIAVSGITFSDALTFEGFSDYEEISNLAAITPTFDEANKAIVVGLRTASAFDGDICTLNFKINDNAEEGDLSVSASSVVKLNSTSISSTVKSSTVTVRSQLLGDITGDNSVDLQDAITLLNHSMLPEIYPIPYVGSVDFNKDGSVDLQDAILLLNYSMLPEIYPIG